MLTERDMVAMRGDTGQIAARLGQPGQLFLKIYVPSLIAGRGHVGDIARNEFMPQTGQIQKATGSVNAGGLKQKTG